VPLLGDIPVLGYLFRYENRTRSKVNTMVFLKPNVIRDEKASSALASDRYDYMRTQLIEGVAPENPMFRGFTPEPIPSGSPMRSPPPPAGAGPGAAAPPSSGPASGAYAASQASSAPAGRVQLIQVATAPDVVTARETQRRLRDAGFDAYWESVPTATGDSVRIRVAVDTARSNVDTTMAELRKLGFNPTPVVQ
jgi:general secretion pathway protein D